MVRITRQKTTTASYVVKWVDEAARLDRRWYLLNISGSKVLIATFKLVSYLLVTSHVPEAPWAVREVYLRCD